MTARAAASRVILTKCHCSTFTLRPLFGNMIHFQKNNLCCVYATLLNMQDTVVAIILNVHQHFSVHSYRAQ